MEQALRETLGERVTWTSPRGGFYVNEDGHRFARLSFSAPTPEQIVEGVSRLAQAVNQLSVSTGVME